jgi:hypothetical protein
MEGHDASRENNRNDEGNPREGDGQSDQDSASTSEDDNDIPEDECGPIRSVMWSWLLADEVIAAVNRRDPIPLPPAAQKPSRKPPSKFLYNGVWNFVEYIPPWTSPDWDEEYEIFEEEGQRRRRLKRDVTQSMRPALLPRDSIRNPTAYALRWGTNPDRGDGRSRLSPVTSTRRRVGLSHAQPTPTGNKDFITIQDYEMATAEFERAQGSLASAGLSLLEYLQSVDGTGRLPELYRSYLELHALIEDDRDFQRLIFGGMTTDEVRFSQSRPTTCPHNVTERSANSSNRGFPLAST